jgi:hypothetical protein
VLCVPRILTGKRKQLYFSTKNHFICEKMYQKDMSVEFQDIGLNRISSRLLFFLPVVTQSKTFSFKNFVVIFMDQYYCYCRNISQY